MLKDTTTREEHTKRFLTVTETAKMTGLSTYYIRQGIREGSIPCIMCGTKYMINYPKFIEILDNASTSSQKEGEAE